MSQPRPAKRVTVTVEQFDGAAYTWVLKDLTKADVKVDIPSSEGPTLFGDLPAIYPEAVADVRVTGTVETGQWEAKPDALAAVDHHWADVLAVVPQPRRDALRRDALRRSLAALAEYERRINWMTTCGGCADRLDADYAQTMRVEDAAIRGYRRAIATLGDVACRTDSPAARWAAEYLTTDPDRLAPAGWREARGSDDD